MVEVPATSFSWELSFWQPSYSAHIWPSLHVRGGGEGRGEGGEKGERGEASLCYLRPQLKQQTNKEWVSGERGTEGLWGRGTDKDVLCGWNAGWKAERGSQGWRSRWEQTWEGLGKGGKEFGRKPLGWVENRFWDISLILGTGKTRSRKKREVIFVTRCRGCRESNMLPWHAGYF